MLGLKWSSIDFERKSITINHKVTEQLVNGKYVPVASDVMKNKTSCRTLPLIPAVEEELLKQKEKQQLYRKAVQEELQHRVSGFRLHRSGRQADPPELRDGALRLAADQVQAEAHPFPRSAPQLCQPDGDERRIHEAGSGVAGAQYLFYHGRHLRTSRLQKQTGVCWGHCEPFGRIQTPQIIMDLSFMHKAYCDEAKSGLSLLDAKEKVAGSFESATSGGDGGIRTHVPD